MGKTVIIGAGLAGLSAGYHARLKNLDFELYEAEANVGGCCRTIERDGFHFDYSGHLLHLKDPYFQSLVRELLSDNLNIIKRNTVIYSNGVFTRYPFQANLFGLPPYVLKDCLLEFVKAYYFNEDLPTGSYSNFYDWIVSKFGKGIGKYFMFPYNEKLWTVPTEEMTCEWLSEYVPKPNLEDVFNGAFEGQSKEFGYNATFWYPKNGGIQALCDALAARVPNIFLNENVVAINFAAKTVHFSSGRNITYDNLISTMPLNKLVKKMETQIPSNLKTTVRKLKHSSVLIINLGVRGANLTDKHWIYLPEKKFTAYRVGVYSNFSEALVPEGTTSFYIEIGYQKGWNIDKEKLIKKAVDEMVKIGLIKDLNDVMIRNVVDLEYAYVIYDKNCSESRRGIMDFLNQHDIISIGRYGNWEYSGMEEAMIQGKQTIAGLASDTI